MSLDPAAQGVLVEVIEVPVTAPVVIEVPVPGNPQVEVPVALTTPVVEVPVAQGIPGATGPPGPQGPEGPPGDDAAVLEAIPDLTLLFENQLV